VHCEEFLPTTFHWRFMNYLNLADVGFLDVTLRDTYDAIMMLIGGGEL
jgi:hypothetical protein